VKQELASSLLLGGSTSPENASPARTDGKGIAEGANVRRQSRNVFANALRNRRGDRSTYDFSNQKQTFPRKC